MGLFGGGNSTSTNENTTNNYDQRQVITTSDSNNSSAFNDNSTTVTNTSVTDAGAFGVVQNIAGQAITSARDQTLAGYNFADHIFDTATIFANAESERAADAFGQAAVMTKDTLVQARDAYQTANASVVTAYGRAQDATLNAYTAAQKAAMTAQAATAEAYADAKGTTNSQKQIIIGVLVVAGVMALAMMKKKG